MNNESIDLVKSKTCADKDHPCHQLFSCVNAIAIQTENEFCMDCVARKVGCNVSYGEPDRCLYRMVELNGGGMPQGEETCAAWFEEN